MASRRSRSASTPSEGEIIESGSDTKATTSQTSVNDIHVDRNTRTDVYSPRSPASMSRSFRERSRSRSPYYKSRGEKRRHDDYDHERGGRATNPKNPNSRYDDRHYSRGGGPHQRRPYYDHDRSDGYDRNLHYNDDYDRRPDKRARTRSRSPFREARQQNRSSGNRLPGRDGRLRDDGTRGRPRQEGKGFSIEQSVSERGKPSVIAQHSRQETETRGYQMQQTHSTTESNRSTNAQTEDSTTENGVSPEPVDEATLIEQRRKRREAIRAKFRDQAPPLLVQALKPASGAESTSQNPPSPATSKDEQDSRQASPLNTPNETPGTQSPTDFKVSRDEELANTVLRDRSGVEKEEPSAADYDPTFDMREDKRRHDKRHFGDEVSAGAYDETQSTKQDVLIPEQPEEQKTTSLKARATFDMFAEDDDDMFAEEPSSSMKANGQPKPSISKPQELDMSMMDNWDDPEGYYNVMLGELINGRYHVQQILGKGMFSSVVRATDSKTGGLVAVKIVRNNDTMRKAGIKEIEILQQLRAADPEDKKHIIKFDRQFDHKGHLCMVFENLSMNLREVLKKFGRDVGINLRAIRAYAQQLFLGLNLLRKSEILHADLKPDNLLVNENRNLLKICDLGSASSSSDNEITPYLVSRFYRAPEIILGVPYDYAIDVWSIGCTLFELFSGKILFTGRNNNQMLRSIMECRGKFPPKFLRRGTLAHLHFDDLLNFCSVEEDKISGRMVTRHLDFKKPTRDLKSRLIGKGVKLDEAEAKEITLFIDLLDRCLNINPEKRCTPSEALRHPFITRTKAQ